MSKKIDMTFVFPLTSETKTQVSLSILGCVPFDARDALGIISSLFFI